MLWSLCDVESGILLRLELNQGKELNSRKEHFRTYGATTATTLRMARPFEGSGKTIVADSWFSSLKTAKALLERGVFFIGNIKTAHRHFPKAHLKVENVHEHHFPWRW